MAQNFRGVWSAIITPFLEDGSIDIRSYENLIAQQCANGIRGVVIAGTTGEGPALTTQEKLSLVKKTKAIAKNDLKIMAGVSYSGTAQAVELAGLLAEAGCDGLLVVTPPYNKPNFSGLLQHYQLIAQKSKIPLCVYHIPGRTSLKLTSEQLAALNSIDGVTSVKESTADLGFFKECLLKAPKGTSYLSGDDLTFLPSLAVGGHGLISVIANIFPKPMCDLQKAFEQGQIKQAQKLFDILFPCMGILFCETNPVPLKAAASLLGLCKNTLRLPMAPASSQNLAAIAAVLKTTIAALAEEGYRYDFKA